MAERAEQQLSEGVAATGDETDGEPAREAYRRFKLAILEALGHGEDAWAITTMNEARICHEIERLRAVSSPEPVDRSEAREPTRGPGGDRMSERDERCYNCKRLRSEHSLGSSGWICPTAQFLSYEDEAKRQANETRELLARLRTETGDTTREPVEEGET